MRTIELINFEKSISEINNNLSHTIFVFEQFSLYNKAISNKDLDKLTTEVYVHNKYSSQFNVKLKDIEESAQKTLEYVFDTLFVFTNTQFEIYLKDIFLFIKDNFELSLGELPQTKVYNTILEKLDIDIEIDLDNLFTSTFDYFKLRRNAIMHRHKNKYFQGALEDLIKGSFKKKKLGLFRANQLNGIQLDSEWKKYSDRLSKGHTIRNFSFSNSSISKFSLEDLIDVFNFYRLYVSKIDELIVSKINRKELVEYCYKKYTECYSDFNNHTHEKYMKAFKRTSIFELNLRLTDDEVQSFYNGV